VSVYQEKKMELMYYFMLTLSFDSWSNCKNN